MVIKIRTGRFQKESPCLHKRHPKEDIPKNCLFLVTKKSKNVSLQITHLRFSCEARKNYSKK